MDLSGVSRKTSGDDPSTNTAISQHEFYDIYLWASSQDTDYFRKMKDCIHSNGWKMTSCFDHKLGELVTKSIENALLKCSHMVCLITKDDCEKNNSEQLMAIEMAIQLFRNSTENGLEGRVIPIRCDVLESSLPFILRTLRGASIEYLDLEERLRRSINTNIRMEREEKVQNITDNAGKFEGRDYLPARLKPETDIRGDDISFGGLSAPPEILARDPRVHRAYAEAARDGTKKVFRTRLMLVGQERVGKTSLKKALTCQGFDKNEGKTDGVDTTNICDINIQVAKAGGKLWSVHKKGDENEETKDREYTEALAEEAAKKLSVAPSQDQQSLEPRSDGTEDGDLNPQEAAESISDGVEMPNAREEHVNASKPIEIVRLVEEMLKEQVRLKEEGTDSGKDEGVSLNIWDFAGQDIYYTTHQVFLNWRAIYVVVFDLSKSLDSIVPPESRDDYYEMAKGGAKAELTCLEFINFWLCSIFAHAVPPPSVLNKNTSKAKQKSPPILIVGTHRDSVTGDANEQKKKIEYAFKKIRNTIKGKPFECHVVPQYYAVENSLEDKDEELIALRTRIKEVAEDEPYMGEEIPIRWLLFEKALAAEKIHYMSLDETKELTRNVGVESEHELLAMLTFYHELGYIVYYGDIDDKESLLRDIVILNPQWLIDVFKQVITIMDPKERDGIVSDAWTTLEDGILEDRLIQHMWTGFLEQKEALVQLMAKFDLICEAPVEQFRPEEERTRDAKVSDDAERGIKMRYYVPSRLPVSSSPEDIGQIKSSTDFYIDFRGFLPDGLFHRLMIRAVRWMMEWYGQSVDSLFYRQITLMVDEEHLAILEMLPPHEATIKVTVYRDSDEESDNHRPPAPNAVKDVKDFVIRTLDSLREQWAKRIRYDICVLCTKCGKMKHCLQECFKHNSLQCGSHVFFTSVVKANFGECGRSVPQGMRPIPPEPMNHHQQQPNYPPAQAYEPLAYVPPAQPQPYNPPMPRAPHQMSHEITEIKLRDLSHKLGAEWRMVGTFLGFNNLEIQVMQEQHPQVKECIFQMLLQWRNVKGVEATKEKLKKALKRSQRGDIVNFIDEPDD